MWGVVKSVLAALVGVQKNQHREEDFNSDKPMAFIVTGIVVTVVFVLLLAAVAFLAAKG
jgi:hypothetical protein